MRRSVFACACLVLIAAASAAQVAPLPPRDRPLAPAAPAGTGAIKGRVVDGQTGNAVVRARVRLMGSGPRQPVVLTDESIIATTTDYGRPFVSSIWRDNVMATQFHPEKSQKVGLGILSNFAGM